MYFTRQKIIRLKKSCISLAFLGHLAILLMAPSGAFSETEKKPDVSDSSSTHPPPPRPPQTTPEGASCLKRFSKGQGYTSAPFPTPEDAEEWLDYRYPGQHRLDDCGEHRLNKDGTAWRQVRKYVSYNITAHTDHMGTCYSLQHKPFNACPPFSSKPTEPGYTPPPTSSDQVKESSCRKRFGRLGRFPEREDAQAFFDYWYAEDKKIEDCSKPRRYGETYVDRVIFPVTDSEGVCYKISVRTDSCPNFGSRRADGYVTLPVSSASISSGSQILDKTSPEVLACKNSFGGVAPYPTAELAKAYYDFWFRDHDQLQDCGESGSKKTYARGYIIPHKDGGRVCFGLKTETNVSCPKIAKSVPDVSYTPEEDKLRKSCVTRFFKTRNATYVFPTSEHAKQYFDHRHTHLPQRKDCGKDDKGKEYWEYTITPLTDSEGTCYKLEYGTNTCPENDTYCTDPLLPNRYRLQCKSPVVGKKQVGQSAHGALHLSKEENACEENYLHPNWDLGGDWQKKKLFTYGSTYKIRLQSADGSWYSKGSERWRDRNGKHNLCWSDCRWYSSGGHTQCTACDEKKTFRAKEDAAAFLEDWNSKGTRSMRCKKPGDKYRAGYLYKTEVCWQGTTSENTCKKSDVCNWGNPSWSGCQ